MKKITRSNIGKVFQELTCLRRNARHPVPDAEPPPPYKDYTDQRQFELPYPDTSDGPKVWDAILQRRTRRDFAPEPVGLSALSLLLWAAQGNTGNANKLPLRASPSAGACYPVETYLAVNRARELPTGVYHYNVRGHALSLLYSKNITADLVNISMEQEFIYNAAAVFIWTAVMDRGRAKYGERAFRYFYLDAGHIAQNVALAAEALGLGSCPIGALFDDEVNRYVPVDGENDTVVYMTAVGKSA